MMRLLLGLLALTVAACTTLGPTPATTAISAIPMNRPGVEAQVGAVPGYFLSGAASDHKGAATGQLSALLEPDRWLGLRGLIAGFRVFGSGNDSVTEPYVGYRRHVGGDDQLSLAGIAYGSVAGATDQLATYHATRVGGELSIDARLLQPTSWASLHLQGAVTGTALSAHGTYCVDATGQGTDCDTGSQANNTMVNGTMSGLYGTATAQLSLDFAPARNRWFHFMRVAMLGSAGEMPLLVNGVQQSGQAYASIGLMLSMGVGAPD